MENANYNKQTPIEELVEKIKNLNIPPMEKGYLIQWSGTSESIPEGWKYFGRNEFGIIIEKI